MRYTVTKQRLQIVGTLWMGGTAATIRDLSQYDLDNIEDVKDRDSVQAWIYTHVGDFQSVTDFRADFHIASGEQVIHEWQDEDSEMTYNDCMYPEED